MKNHISRRDFLKLAGLLPLSIAAPRLANSLALEQQAEKVKNIIVIVFDAFSASNISLYGYARETTPNIDRLAERAVVYHNHYAGGNFTTPGTASLLTGTLPWTHRSFHHGEPVEDSFVHKNIFSAFQNYYRVGYSHNPLVNVFLKQFSGSIDNWIPREKLFLNNDMIIPTLFKNDDDIASVSWLRAMKNKEEGYAYSLFLSHLYGEYRNKAVVDLQSQFPGGMPFIDGDNYYVLEQAIDWLIGSLGGLPEPFAGYFHFLPPHAPYSTHRDFYGRFKNDGWKPDPKPVDAVFKDSNDSFKQEDIKRSNYDEYILYVDREFGRLFDYLDTSGLLDNTWVVLTSDHGEMFERGIIGHKTPVLYEPIIRIPLVIFEPGRKTREDIYSNTSVVDVLPTLLYITGQQPINWSEGAVLPPFSDSQLNESRNLYVLEAKKNQKYAPLTIATTALIKGQYKLTYFFGYDDLGSAGSERFEMYDLENDPEELNDLYTIKRETSAELLDELKKKLAVVNEPYQ
jgi:arylsulfatase A-like enzyme